MAIIKFFKKIFNNNSGVTLVEIMIAVSILSIAMSYFAYDSLFSSRAIYELEQRNQMMNAAQEVVERLKLTQVAGSFTVNGFNVDVNIISNPMDDSNLTTYLKKVIMTVHPQNANMSDIVLVSYMFSDSISAPMVPTNLVATPTINSIVLNWNAPPYAETFTVKRGSISGGPYEIIAEGLTTPMYNDTTALSEVSYYYVVSASNLYGESSNSSEASTSIIVYNDTINPVEDSYIRGGSYANTNYGTSSNLYISSSWLDGNNYKSYFKFDLSPVTGTILSAKLRIYGYNSSKNQHLSANLYSLDNDDWTESGLTWNNAPTSNSVLGVFTFNGKNNSAYKEIDVTSYCSTELDGNGIASFVIDTTDAALGQIISKEGIYKPQLTIQWSPYNPPSAPINLKAVGDNRQVNLSWDAVVGAQSYTIKRSGTSGGPYTIINSGVVGTTYANTDLTNGQTYYYVVTAFNDSGESGNSNEVSAMPNLTTTVNYSPIADSYVRDGTYSGTNFGSSSTMQVDNSTEGTGEKRVGYLKFDLTNVRGEISSAKIRIYGSNIEDSSNTLVGCYSVTNTSWEEGLINYNNAPTFGTELASTMIDGAQSFKELDITSYVTQKMSDDKIVNIALAGIGTSKLLAFNTKESSIGKPQLIIQKTLLAPEPVTNLQATPDNTSVTLNWTASDETDYYAVYRSTVSGGPYTQIKTGITGTSYLDSSLINGNAYYYVVKSINAAGNSPYSAQVNATPNLMVTVTLSPLADASVESYYQDSNYGANPNIAVAYNATNNKKAYFKFDLSSYSNNTIVSAVFKIYGNSTSDTFNINAHAVSNTTWLEQGTGSISWNNAPTLGSVIGNVNVGKTRQYNNIDITSYVENAFNNSDIISFGLNTDMLSTAEASFNSKEDSSSYKPQLIIKMAQGIPEIPSNLVGTGENASAILSWSASNGATTYTVKRSTMSEGPYTIVASNITTTTYTNTGLANGIDYYYVVSAVNDIGESSDSNQVCVIPKSGTSSIVLSPSNDSYTRDGIFTSTNFGSTSKILVSTSPTADAGNISDGYVRFDLSGLSTAPTQAILMLTGNNTSGGANKNYTINIYKTTDTWNEYTITNDNAPSSGTYIGTFTVNKSYVTHSIDITSFIKTEYQGDKQFSIYIKSTSNDKVISFSSREGTDPPLLQIIY